MQKPVDLILEETENNVISVLNVSGLPISVVAMLFNKMNNEIQAQATNTKQVLRRQWIEYEKVQAEEEAKAKEEEIKKPNKEAK